MPVRICAGVLAACLLIAGPVYGADDKVSSFGVYQGYSPQIFPDQIKSSFYLPMRDGVRLAVDLYRPGIGGKAAEGRFPVVWHHSFDGHYVATPDTNATYAAPELTKFG
jgi:predicted acyl esterase